MANLLKRYHRCLPFQFGSVIVVLSLVTLHFHQCMRLTASISNDAGTTWAFLPPTMASRLLLRETTADANNNAVSPFSALPPILPQDSFGACLLVKGDNDLLTEWIPYHFTVLPLRHVFVASDVGNSERPEDILHQWTTANTGLHYHVVPIASIFNATTNDKNSTNGLGCFNRKLRQQGKPEINSTNHPLFQREAAHHLLMEKQRALITHCTKYMQDHGIKWVTYHDTDEFLVVNTQRVETEPNNPSASTTYGTVMEVIQEWDKIDGNSFKNDNTVQPCQVLPRVTVGALENYTCPGDQETKEFASQLLPDTKRSHSNSLSTLPQVFHTLRFQQHARTDDFSKNRFAKTFVNVRSLTNSDNAETPHNIHRPFPRICPRPVADVESSPFYLMHYVCGWERFQAKSDARRGFEEWQARATIADSTSCCDQRPYLWIHAFVELVGVQRAQYLLGEVNTTE